jgi:hypothetical protein
VQQPGNGLDTAAQPAGLVASQSSPPTPAFLPVSIENQPDTTPSQDMTPDLSENDQGNMNWTGDMTNPAFILISQNSVTGLLENMIARTMLKQCDNQAQPALDFYECLENTTDLPKVWSSMGLNATLLRIKTIDMTTLTGANITERKDVFVTFSDTNPDDKVVTMQDLLKLVSAQTPEFCRNIDSLLNCLDPYLATCFPESPSSNNVNAQNDDQNQDLSMSVPAGQLQNQQSTTENSLLQSTTLVPDSDASSNDTDSTQDQGVDQTQDSTDDMDDMDLSFFGLPMMYTQREITYFIRQTFGMLCDNNAQTFNVLINSVPCLMSTIGQQNCEKADDAVNTIQSLMENSNSTSIDPNPDICGAMKNAAECHLDLADESCGQDVANIGQSIYQYYFDSISCMDAPGSNNVVNVRQPFNQMIL